MAPAQLDSLARFRNPEGGVCGAGFLMGGRHLMTCAHVVEDALASSGGELPRERLAVDLPFAGRHHLAARVVAWHAPRAPGEMERDPVADVAVLELAEPVDAGLAPADARLSPPARGTAFLTRGFPDGYDNGVDAQGRLLSADSGGWIHLRDDQSLGYFIEPGFSGAPVLDARDGRLLGMVVAADADSGRRLGFAIPTATLARAWPPLAKPYKELLAFEEEDAGLFFGRERAVGELAGKLRTRPLVFVVGASGAGKSSLVMAGLVPRLRAGGAWRIARTRPGRRPLYNLADALAALMAPEGPADRLRLAEETAGVLEAHPERVLDRGEACLNDAPPGTRLLLVADQLEELFAGRNGSGEAGPFLEALAAIGRQTTRNPRVVGVAALRADFTGRALQHLSLAEVMRDADVKLGAMAPAELARAIEEPAAAFGVGFEPGLVTEIVSGMAQAPGALPLMQHALDRLWARQEERVLTAAAYRGTGGIEGSLAEHAEEVYGTLHEDERRAARRVLLRLVRLAVPGEQVEDTRATARRDEIGETDWPVAERLASERLATLGRDPASGVETAEVAHEALIRAWPRFRRWLDEDREFGLWRQRLRGDVDKWGGGNEDALLRGGLLAEAEHWRRDRGAALNETEGAFIDASVQRARAERAEREAAETERRALLEEKARILEDKAASQRRALRNLRLALAAVALAVVAAVGLALQQYHASRTEAELAARADALRAEAEEAAVRAEAEARRARASELATRARALFEGTPGRNALAALMALEGLALGAGAEAQTLIAEIMALTPRGVRDLPGVDPFTEMLPAPNGRTFLAWTHNGWHDDPGRGVAVAIDARTGEVLARVAQDGWTEPVPSPDGRWLAVGGFGRRFQLVDLETGGPVLDLPRPHRTVAAFSPDSRTLWIAGLDGVFEVRRAPLWRLVEKGRWREDADTRMKAPRLWIDVALDGERVMIADRDGAWLGSAVDGFEALPEQSGRLTFAGFDPTGRHLVTIAGAREVELRDPASGAVRRRLVDDPQVKAWAFSPGGSLLALGWDDGLVRVYGLDEDTPPLVLDEDTTGAAALTFTSDGAALVATHDSGVMRVFDPGDGTLRASWPMQPAWGSPAPGAAGSMLVGDERGAILRLDLAAGEPETVAETGPAPRGVDPLRLDPETGLLVAGLRLSGGPQSWTGLELRDIASGEALWRVAVNGRLRGVEFSPDGSFFVTNRFKTGGEDLTIRETATGRVVKRPAGASAEAIALGGDGTRLLALDEALGVYSSETGARLFTLGEPGGTRGLHLLPGGRTILTHGADGAFRAFDAIEGRELWRRDDPAAAASPVFSADGSRYLVRSADKRSFEVREVRTGELAGRLPATDPYARPVLSDTGDRALLLHPPKLDAETGGRFAAAALWDVGAGRLLRELRGRSGLAPGHGQFGPDGYVRVLFAGDRLSLLDARSGSPLWEEQQQPPWTGTPVPLPDRPGEPLAVVASGVTSFRDPRSGAERLRVGLPFETTDVSADGRLVLGVVASGGETPPSIALVDMDSGGVLWRSRPLPKDEGRITSVHFSGDGSRALAFISSDRYPDFLKVLDISDGRVLATLESETRVERGVPLSDPDLVATEHWSGLVRVWRLSTGEVTHQLAHGATASGASVAAAAPRALTWEAGSLRLWDLEDGRQLAHRVSFEGEVSRAALSPSGRLVAYSPSRGGGARAAGESAGIELWQAQGDVPDRRLALEDEPGALRFDAGGRLLAALVGDARIRVWELASLRPVATLEARAGAKFAVDGAFGFVDGGRHLSATEYSTLSGALGRHLRVWDLTDGVSEIARIDDPYRVHRPQAPLLLNANRYGARLWPLRGDAGETVRVPGAGSCCDGVAGRPRQPFDVGYDRVLLIDPETRGHTRIAPSAASDSISAAAFTRDLGRVYVAEREREGQTRVPGAVRLVRVPDGELLAEVRPDATIAEIVPAGDGGSAVLLGTPGGWIVKGRYERGWVWQPDADRLIPLEAGDGPMGTVEVSPDGRSLAVGYGVTEVEGERWQVRGTPRVLVWATGSGDRLLEAPLDEPPADIAFSRDGRLMVVRGSFEFVAFETESWTELRRVRAEHGWTNGRTAILANEWIMVPDGKGLRMVSIRSGEEIFLPQREGNPGMSFAADDRTFALRAGGVVTVWRLGGEPGGGSHVRQMARFGPVDAGSRILFAGADDGLYVTGGETMRRALYQPREIEAEVCRRIGRGLTDEEIAEHLAEAANPCVR